MNLTQDRIQAMVDYLLNKNTDVTMRDNVATNLQDSDDLLVFNALLEISEQEANEILQDSAAESLSVILNRNRNNFDFLQAITMQKIYRVVCAVRQQNMHYFEIYQLEDFEDLLINYFTNSYF